jgi:hypothetical protein
MAEFYESGNYKLHELTLVNYRGQPFDLAGIFSYIELYEDIFSTTLSAKIAIEDAVDLFQNFPIIGKEKLIISYSTRGFDAVRVELDCYLVPTRTQIKAKHQFYTMSFMSTEGLTNQTKIVARSLSGNITDNVESILRTELGSTKAIDSDRAANSITFIPPRQAPFEAINTMLNRAKAVTSSTHTDIVLYETVDGYSIKSLSNLVTKPPEWVYKVGRLNRSSDKAPVEDEFLVLNDFQIIQEAAPISSIASGGYGGTIGVYDPITRSYSESTYDLLENKEDFNYLGEHRKIPNNDAIQKSAKSSVFKYVVAGTKDESYLHRNAKFEQLFNTVKIVADVAGNSKLRVGHIVELDFPSNTTADMETYTRERFLKGKYIVSSLKHSMRSGLGGYRTVMELCKDSVDTHVDDSADLIERLTVKNVV